MNIDWNFKLVADNELWRLVALFGVVTAALIGAKMGRAALERSAITLETRGAALAGTVMRAFARSLPFIILAFSLPLAGAFLRVGPRVHEMLQAANGVLFSLAIGFTLYQLVDVLLFWLRRRAEKTASKMDDMLVPIVRASLRVTIIVLTALQAIQSLTDKPLTSMLAGLGVGGLAVALAAQDTIKHFFGSMVLFADKPFQVGERITVDTIDGVVEEVGFRSTRIRTLEGHLVSIPNGDLANRTIINIGRRPYIRHRAVLGIPYDTPSDKIQRAIEIVRNLLENHEGMNPELPARVSFDEFASSAISILVLYWYHPPDFWKYREFNERLCLQIVERFRDEGIEFAFPTQTLFLAGDTGRAPVNIRRPDNNGGEKAESAG